MLVCLLVPASVGISSYDIYSYSYYANYGAQSNVGVIVVMVRRRSNWSRRGAHVTRKD